MFLDSLDIANRALQYIGAPKILSVTEDSKANLEITNAYDKLRRAEMRRNVWSFSIRKTILRSVTQSTLLLNPGLYSNTTLYTQGDIVRDVNGTYWISLIGENTGNAPAVNNEAWDMYFGPLTADVWSSGTAYGTGELVYMTGTVPGTYQLYQSLSNVNSNTPNVAAAWVSTTTYYQDQMVSFNGSQWRNTLLISTGITPADPPAAWSAVTTYTTGQTAQGTDGNAYSSVTNSNTGNNPVTDNGTNWTNLGQAGAWSRTPTLTAADVLWNPIGVALKPLNILYPAGTGPSTQVGTKNVYFLPAGYLRKASQDPKAGVVSILGAPSERVPDDWLIENGLLISRWVQPITFRFAADVTVVRTMDDMFCEGLACRIAEATCKSITQSNPDKQLLATEYAKFMTEARTVNAIETGTKDIELDDFLACRY